MKIGIFFGGTSREREISFAGGRTVFDNLDKGLFQPVPIFVDSQGHFILLDWQYLYKGTIRDFYPPVAALPATRHPWQVYIESLGELSQEALTELISHVGRQVEASELPKLMDFAFLALHGPGGEDGAIQGLLEWVGIPYSGSGILPSALGIDKIAQKRLMQAAGLATPKYEVFDVENPTDLDDLVENLGLPLVVKAPRQGSSIGVSIVRDVEAELAEAVNRARFVDSLSAAEWLALDENGRLAWVRQLADIREGIGLPVQVWEASVAPLQTATFANPEALYDFINEHFTNTDNQALVFESLSGETQVLIESFVAGREFSCIVVEDENGEPLALPPTEIVKGTEVFDYRAK
ncbi:MAG: D-alanine--D-alanine ligase, partial [Hymenobacter sp.]